jgi:hypothetical protein
MRLGAWVGVVVLAALTTAPACAQVPDDALKIYAVNVVKTPPFQKPFTGYGIYLGQGLIITAAHVVGHWPLFTRPRVLIAGQNLPATLVKQGSFDDTDLALLSVDQDRLPVALRLRRNPLCKQPPPIGLQVIDVNPDTTSRAQTISAKAIAPALRNRFGTLISSEQGSGSGLFDAERRCLVGIMSGKVQKYAAQMKDGHIIFRTNGFAGYYVPAATIASFLPANVHF